MNINSFTSHKKSPELCYYGTLIEFFLAQPSINCDNIILKLNQLTC